MTDRNSIRDRAAAVLAMPAARNAARSAWQALADRIAARAAGRNPRPMSFEVHHEMEVAREAMLAAIADGKEIAIAAEIGAAAVGLGA